MRNRIPIWALLGCFAAATDLRADEYYVSASKGKGTKGGKSEPVADLGAIASRLKAGDTVHIAGGVYYGKMECGVDEIRVPVTILGGYSDDFSKRDPWGEHRTVLSGKNKAESFQSGPRLSVGDRKFKNKTPCEIVLDGLIVDNGERNGYLDEANLRISRMKSSKGGGNATPDRPGIFIDATGVTSVVVTNCIVMNCAPHHTTGALQVMGSKGTKCAIRNNLLINNTGAGICCGTVWRGDPSPQFTLENNTVLYTWRYDPLEAGCGSAVRVESFVTVAMRGNVFAFSDYAGIDNPNRGKIGDLSENLFHANLQAPYAESKKKIALKDVGTGTEFVEGAKENSEEAFQPPVPEAWGKAYAGRKVADRGEADEKGETEEPAPDAADVYLHRLDVEGALKCGESKILGKYGCEKPAAK